MRLRSVINAVWLVSAALALLIFMAAIPRGYALRFSGAGIGVPIDAPSWYVAAMGLAHGVVSILAGLVSLGLAALLFWKKREEPMTLFVSLFLLAYGIVVAGPLDMLNGFLPSLIPGAPAQNGMAISPDAILEIQSALFAVMPLLFYLFPNGRFVPSWTRYAALLLLLVPAFIRVFSAEWTSTMTPLAWFIISAYVVLLGAGIYAQIYRYRRVASPVERQQSKWVVFGLLLSFVIMGILQIPYAVVLQIPAGVAHPWWQPLNGLAWWLTLTILPLSLAIAVMRYRLWDIDVIINRALVYGTLTASIAAIYILLIVILGALFQTSGNLVISLLATALVAVLFQPWRERLQRGVNRLTYGERDDPYAVISRLGQRLEATLAPDAVLPTIVETVAQALRVPYAAIELMKEGGRKTQVTFPSPIIGRHDAISRIAPNSRGIRDVTSPSSFVRLTLIYQHEPLGELVVAPRVGEEKFSDADMRLLETLANQASIAAHAVRLTSDLQHSRARLVTAREEERRRIRRDLHDGLGPVLASLAMQADNAREWTHIDPDKTEAALAEITVKAQAALQDIRRLVYDLRPPALDELGLVGALRQSAANFPNGLHIEIDAPEPLPLLSAAVEVAAYRIAQETLNNAARHSRARHCTVRISTQDGLRLEISDDGVGLPPDVRAGVGLISMRERAVELGGSCMIESTRGGGTCVIVRLPLAH